MDIISARHTVLRLKDIPNLLLYRAIAVQSYGRFSTEGGAWFTQSHQSGYLPGKRI